MSTKTPSKTIMKAVSRLQMNDEVSCISTRTSISTNTDRPSPSEFDKFLPWVCLQFEIIVEVTVKKAVKEKYDRRKTSHEIKHSGKSKSPDRKTVSSGRLKSTERKPVSQISVTMSPKKAPSPAPEKEKKPPSPAPEKEKSTLFTDRIPITAYYDSSGHLVELGIVGSPVKIQQKAIKCIKMCMPFYPTLLKFSITKGGLSSEVLYEVAKLLSLSNITDICLDDSYVREGNYYILLDKISSLKVLSLKRCKINDSVCKEIATRIDLGRPASSLTVLDLGSNLITDRGVYYIADVLRRNRSLLHLSLSSNNITDDGLRYIMNNLKEFPLTEEEILDMKKRRLELVINVLSKLKEHVHQHHASTDAALGSQVHFRSGKLAGKPRSVKRKKQSTLKLEMPKTSTATIQKEKFIDVFDDNNIVIRDGYMHCIGNMALCSLNLAYNDLDFFSVKRILDVLVYQSKISKTHRQTGLIRLVLDGNRIPEDCEEINEIRLHLCPLVSTASQRAFRSTTNIFRK